MHDLTNPVRQAVDHEQLLRAALHAEVDRLEPCDCLTTIRTRRIGVWLVALVATVGVLMILAGLLMLNARHEPPPAPTSSPWEA